MFLAPYLAWSLSPIGSDSSEAQKPISVSAKAATIPAIPQEIIYEIVDHLVTDAYFRPILRSCALVSRLWVIPCQRHLFHTVFFSLRDTSKWLEVFPVPEQSPAHHVKYLHLSLEGNYYAPHEFFQRIQSFPNVEGITMSGDGGPGQSWWMPSSGRLPRSATSLTITRGKITLLKIRNVMAQLPNLDSLTISGSLRAMDRKKLQGIGKVLKGKFGGRLQLKRLSKNTDADIANMLLEIPTGLYFTEMDIHGTYYCLLSTAKLVEACAQTLEKLSYAVNDYDGLGAHGKSLSFAKLPNLRDMRLTVHWTAGDLLWVSTALGTIKPITSPRLSTIRLKFIGHGLPYIPFHLRGRLIHDLKLIDESIARIEHEFAGVVDVTIIGYPGFEI